MYIFHWAILVYGINYIFPKTTYAQKLLVFIPYAAVVYLAAELSYRFYESKFLVLKDRLFPKKEPNLNAPPDSVTARSQHL
jgi:peptidoglycan/LPS O-acetylase OafA/YrhL